MNPNTEHNLYNLIVNCSRIMNKASGQLFQCQLRLPCPPPLSCSTPLLFKEQFCGLSPSLWTGPNKMFKRSSYKSELPPQSLVNQKDVEFVPPEEFARASGACMKYAATPGLAVSYASLLRLHRRMLSSSHSRSGGSCVCLSPSRPMIWCSSKVIWLSDWRIDAFYRELLTPDPWMNIAQGLLRRVFCKLPSTRTVRKLQEKMRGFACPGHFTSESTIYIYVSGKPTIHQTWRTSDLHPYWHMRMWQWPLQYINVSLAIVQNVISPPSQSWTQL